jgi:hypothetical protein
MDFIIPETKIEESAGMVSARGPIQFFFSQLWSDYTAFNPQAKRIYDLILERERKADPSVSALVNDHIALRTYNIPKIGLEAMARIVAKHGFEKRGEYIFEQKKLRAWHFEHTDENSPKIFISELETEKLSPLVQQTAQAAADAIESGFASSDEFLWSGRGWKADHATYQRLLAESEYAAWMYAFGFRANHFTISFNHLKTFARLEELNDFVRAAGYRLNQSGGEIKGTPQALLEQSSTLAEVTRVEFADGVFDIPACYYEFARRYPMAGGALYQGFISSSADKIFESTDVRRSGS